jgi:hypothetical protein
MAPRMNFNYSNVYDRDILKENQRPERLLGLGGFLGTEYFIRNNVATGTELGMYFLNISSAGTGSIKYKNSIYNEETGIKSRTLNSGFVDAPAQVAPWSTIYFFVYL